MRRIAALSVLLALGSLPACKTSNTAQSVASAGADAVSSVPSLVNVNLSNVLNNLALDLHIDKANIPINAQIPISIAANVCGVSINVLSIGAGGGSSKGCTAQTTSPALEQAVQQQLAANGSVGGGAQTNAPATGTTSTAPATASPTTTTTTPQTPPPTTPPKS
jgi:hypothetical protein